jgi:hypothetical protein
MTSEVTDLIKALRDGTMTLDEVALRFRERKWPRRRKEPPTTYLEMASRTLDDPEPHLADSFDDVIDAYDRGDITLAEYHVLSDAVAEAKREEDRRLAEGDSKDVS